jgi:phosphatidylglycerophosphate synthase
MLDRLVVLAPALVPAAYFIVGLLVYTGLCLIGRRPPTRTDKRRGNAFDFFIHYFLWLIQPIERAVVALRLTPNHLTLMALVCCAGAGLAIATRHLATAGWLYIIAGGLDVLDGRLARATRKTSRSGAFLDSVSDRWGELFVFSGFAWFLRDSAWLFAVLLAIAGSVMVSYTRSRGESLGIKLDGGVMQRAERICLVSLATLVTAWFDAVKDTQEYGIVVIGVGLAITGVLASGTAAGRLIRGFRELRARDVAEIAEVAAVDPSRPLETARGVISRRAREFPPPPRAAARASNRP